MDDRGPLGRLFGDGTDDGDEDGDDEWRFSVAEVGPDESGDENPAPEREPIEPGSVSPEHAAFVIAGAALTLLIVLDTVFL